MDLLEAHCSHVGEDGKIPPGQARADYLPRLQQGWQIDEDRQTLFRRISLRDYSEVMMLANHIAWLANREDHHPSMTLEYKTCHVEFTTHSAKGLSINDFICAAQIDRYLGQKT